MLCGPQRKEKLIFPKENYCPDPKGAVSGLRRPHTESGRALPARQTLTAETLKPEERHQPELFPPPDAEIWRNARSCESQDQRQSIIDQIDAEISWRSFQFHTLKRSAKGRIVDCCDYFDGRKFTLQELKRRKTKLMELVGWSVPFEAALYGATRRELRRRKSAPLDIRLQAYLDPIACAGGGAWKPCPTYEKLSLALGVCVDSISNAFRKLEEDPESPLAFACAYSGATRCRQKHVALKSWLKYDGLPLHFEKEGRHRKLRPTFRKGVEGIEPPPFVSAQYGRKSKQHPEATQTVNLEPSEEGNSDFCLSDSIRLTPADKDNPQRIPEKQPFRYVKPLDRKADLSRSLENAAWRAAREAKDDGELFWDNSKPRIPLPTLKTIIYEAFRTGLEWRKHVRPALRFAIREAHAAACLSHIYNPGAFATAIFREKIGTMLPDPEHLAKVIEERRAKPATPRPQRHRTPRPDTQRESVPATPLPHPRPNSAILKKQAEARAMDRLNIYIEANKTTFGQFTPDDLKGVLFAKLKEFTHEEIESQSEKS